MLFSAMVDEALVKKVAGLQDDADVNDDSVDAAAETRTWASHQFWEFIDQLLDEMREDVCGEPDAELRKTAWAQ
jgi:hypothetical protein